MDDSFLNPEDRGILTQDQIRELQDCLSEAVIKCSERCLYRSAKW